jgi:hypothetical protein
VVAINAAEAVRNALVWFETNSGWAPPDPDTLAEWEADGVCRAPDDCLVTPSGWCAHGLASWCLVLGGLDDRPAAPGGDVRHPSRLDPKRPDYAAILSAHQRAVDAGDAGYTDPGTGLFVMTARYLRDRGYCCDHGCRHCPFIER